MRTSANIPGGWLRRAAHGAALVALGALTLLTGCETTQYIIQQGLGQLEVVANSVPIDDVLAGGGLEPEAARKLRLIVEAREFAVNALGLSAGRSYTLYHETGGEPVSYNVSASRRDALEPKSWDFPVIGRIDYIGYFNKADAEAQQARLESDGYDTWMYPVSAYSTLGYFPDPVHSSMLKRDDGVIVDTIIHELAHNTIYVNGNSNFNESMATFIGRQGAILFYEQRGEEGRAMIDALRRQNADTDKINAWLIELNQALRDFYASGRSSQEKIDGREAVFQQARERFANEVAATLAEPGRYRGYANLPTNNAYILLNQRYNLDLGVMSGVYERRGGDFAAFLDEMRAAARAADPFEHLRNVAK